MPDAADAALAAEKVEQARTAVGNAAADAWLVFPRETGVPGEPSLPSVLGFDVAWPTAVVVGADESAVVLDRRDAPAAERLGVHAVRAYDESAREPLRGVLDGLGARTVALTPDRAGAAADGPYRRPRDHLPDREFVSAAAIVRDVRGLKSPTEHDRIERAARETEALLGTAANAWTPGTTEAEFAAFLDDRMDARGLDPAWARDYCPTVHMGGESGAGHTRPGGHTLDAGDLLHVDFGVRTAGYVADVQRLWVRGAPGDDLRAAFRDVRAAVDAGVRTLEAGVAGHAVDAAARAELTDRGRPAFDHAFGHQVGRAVHDGGTLLGPLRDRYGDLPRGTVRAGEVYAIELGVRTDDGYVGTEEMVRVTDDGPEWVLPPQTALRTL